MRRLLNIVLIGAGLLASFGLRAGSTDIYIIYYATWQGKTGHVGIAVDNYNVFVKDSKGMDTVHQWDTVCTQELAYFDLWPNDDYFTVRNTGKNIPAVYFQLPLHSGDEITLNSLFYQGLPHKENYPTDGILKIKTTPAQDDALKNFLQKTIASKKPFNARKFNCTDFVKIAVEFITHTRIRCGEFVGIGWSSTPNKLYRTLRKMPGVSVVKNGDGKAQGTFLRQRVFYKIFHRNKI